MIKFCEQISIANVTRCCGASCTCARANWKGTFVIKQSLMLKLPKWYIYDFGPRQCLAMPASSYQAEVRHLSHALILLITRLFEVLIPKVAFKFGANNFNFIRVRLGQVRLGWVMLC